MTWVVGMASNRGYAALLSDIRVSLPSGKYEDCLRKVYAVGPHIAVGFSGSVLAGFVMVADLTQYLHLEERNKAWIPRVVAEKWKRGARRLFAQLVTKEPSVEKLGCHLLFAAVAPTENVTGTEYPQSYVWRMRSPDFEPEYVEPDTLTAIGSGNADVQFRGALAQLNSERVKQLLDRLEQEDPGEFKLARAVLFALSLPVIMRPIESVSPHLHLCVVTRGGVGLATNSRNEHYPDGRTFTFMMPSVAETYDQFEMLMKTRGYAAAHGSCMAEAPLGQVPKTSLTS